MNPSNFYTVIVSTFTSEISAAGTLTFESEHPYILKELPQEGYGMKKFSIYGDWDYMNAGGCGKFGQYEKNPAFAFNLTDDADI